MFYNQIQCSVVIHTDHNYHHYLPIIVHYYCPDHLYMAIFYHFNSANHEPKFMFSAGKENTQIPFAFSNISDMMTFTAHNDFQNLSYQNVGEWTAGKAYTLRDRRLMAVWPYTRSIHIQGNNLYIFPYDGMISLNELILIFKVTSTVHTYIVHIIETITLTIHAV